MSIFRGCTNLSSLSIPANVTSLGWYFAKDCTKLSYIELPDTLTSLGSFAFQNTSASCIHYNSLITRQIGEDALPTRAACTSAPIRTPTSAPIQTPTSAPIQTPTSAPIQTPIQSPSSPNPKRKPIKVRTHSPSRKPSPKPTRTTHSPSRKPTPKDNITK